MWRYNYDYLCHGLHGFKYIEKKRGKNGKWQYIYPDSAEGKRIDTGRRIDEAIYHPLTNPNRVLLYGRTPGSISSTAKPASIRTRYAEKDSSGTNGKFGNSSGTNGKFEDNRIKSSGHRRDDESAKNKSSEKEPYKSIVNETDPKLNGLYERLKSKGKEAVENSKIYNKTLGSEDFKKYEEYKTNPDVRKKMYKDLWKNFHDSMSLDNERERAQYIEATKKLLNEFEKYGDGKEAEEWLDKNAQTFYFNPDNSHIKLWKSRKWR